MFVREDGRRLSRSPKHFHDRLHQFVSGIKVLAPVIVWVIAMLPNETHAIDSKVVTPESQRIFYGWINREPIFFCEAAAAIGGWRLGRVQGDELSTWLRKYAVR